MTPFDSWYAANVEPNLPKDFPPPLRAIGKQQASEIWNAALLEAEIRVADFFHGADNEISGNACVRLVQAARVTP